MKEIKLYHSNADRCLTVTVMTAPAHWSVVTVSALAKDGEVGIDLLIVDQLLQLRK